MGVLIAASGGSGAATGGKSSSGTTTNPGTCGSTTLVPYPFGCKFAWGAADDKIGTLGSATYLQFVSTWVDSTISAAGKYTTCNACTWLTNSIKSTNLIPAYYAYIIGFLGHANGIVDGNQTGSKKLTTDGAALVKANRQAIVDAYGWYAKETYKVWPSKPLVWLLEGDFVQLVDSGQSSPLSYAELSSLVVDITCAIKSRHLELTVRRRSERAHFRGCDRRQHYRQLAVIVEHQQTVRRERTRPRSRDGRGLSLGSALPSTDHGIAIGAGGDNIVPMHN